MPGVACFGEFVVDRVAEATFSRHNHVRHGSPGRKVYLARCGGASQQGVLCSGETDKVVGSDTVVFHLRQRWNARPDGQVDQSPSEVGRFARGLPEKAQAHSRRDLGHSLHENWSESGRQGVMCLQGERALQFLEMQVSFGCQHL